MPFRAESSSFRAYSARKPFPFHVCTMNADGSGNKRLTEKSEGKDKTAYRLVQIGPNSICCYFIIWEGYFLETQKNGQAANCAPSRKINLSFRLLVNIRPCPAELLLSSFAVFMLKILKYNVSQVI